MKQFLFLTLLLMGHSFINGQKNKFPEIPQGVNFVTSDIVNFWRAFDSIEKSTNNPFENYINSGSIGLQGFIPNRIMSADSLLKMVKIRTSDYERNRGIETLIRQKEKEIKPYFYALEYWYPDAVYPPVYFVIGRFNSGGTVSENGLLIGTEMLEDLDGLKELIIHESIHFQQKWPEEEATNVLIQSIQEGAADFIAELITGEHGNKAANDYGNSNIKTLCKEFVETMYTDNFQDWLYGTSGKDERPNDLGYWIGYEIVRSYYDKKEDKKLAVHNILNIDDFDIFMKESGYLDPFLKQ